MNEQSVNQTQLPRQPQLPRLRLDFYNTAVLLSRWEDDGRLVTHPVSVHDVVSACTRVELSSGLLPANTLFWKQRANQSMLGIYVPARRWQVQTESRTYHLPMPPFVFVGYGTSYQIFAVKRRPDQGSDALYHAPCPNVFGHGGICQGNTPFPACTIHSVYMALNLFLEGSLFNTHLSQSKCQSYPGDVRRLWEVLHGRKRFPLSELVPAQMTLGKLL